MAVLNKALTLLIFSLIISILLPFSLQLLPSASVFPFPDTIQSIIAEFFDYLYLLDFIVPVKTVLFSFYVLLMFDVAMIPFKLSMGIYRLFNSASS